MTVAYEYIILMREGLLAKELMKKYFDYSAFKTLEDSGTKITAPEIVSNFLTNLCLGKPKKMLEPQRLEKNEIHRT